MLILVKHMGPKEFTTARTLNANVQAVYGRTRNKCQRKAARTQIKTKKPSRLLRDFLQLAFKRPKHLIWKLILVTIELNSHAKRKILTDIYVAVRLYKFPCHKHEASVQANNLSQYADIQIV